jgi:hypothetical protein
MEALLVQLPKTEGQPRIYRRNRNMINRLSITLPLASLLALYLASYIASCLALTVSRNRNAVYLSGLVPHALGIAQKDLEFCDIMAQNPEPIVYTLVISRKIMTISQHILQVLC